jgi:hypothetical protein
VSKRFKDAERFSRGSSVRHKEQMREMSGDPRERIWSDEEIVELLEKAAAMGLPLDQGCELERYSVSELDRMVNQRQ